jgi:hypothetical protein
MSFLISTRTSGRPEQQHSNTQKGILPSLKAVVRPSEGLASTEGDNCRPALSKEMQMFNENPAVGWMVVFVTGATCGSVVIELLATTWRTRRRREPRFSYGYRLRETLGRKVKRCAVSADQNDRFGGIRARQSSAV